MEAQVPCERRVDLAERVGVADLGHRAQVVVASVPQRGREKVAAAVEREHRGLVEGGGEERAGRVRLVVTHVEDPPAVAPAPHEVSLLAREVQVHVCLRRQALRRAALERVPRPAAEVGAGAVREGHRVHLVDGDPALLEAVGDREVREGLRVLVAVEPLLLGERDDPPVLDQTGGRVVAEAVDAEDIHRVILFDRRSERPTVATGVAARYPIGYRTLISHRIY